MKNQKLKEIKEIKEITLDEIRTPIKFEFTGKLKTEDTELFRKLPERSTKGAAGYDFYNPERIKIEAHKTAEIHTGIKAQFPNNIVLKLYNRSSNGKKKGIMLANGVAVIDSDYYNNINNDGEISFMFYNFTDHDTIINAGDKLGQGVFEKFYTIDNEPEILNIRCGGWGSTGK